MDFKSSLKSLESETPAKQIEALNNCIRIIEENGKNKNSNSKQYTFPTEMLRDVFVRLISEKDNSKAIFTFQKYAAYNDVLYNSWEVLKDITPKSTPSETYQKNYLNLIDKLGLKNNNKMKIKLPAPALENGDSEYKLLCEAEDGPKFHFDVGKVKRSITLCWKCISNWKLTKDTHKRTLLILLDRLLGYLQDPLRATDFLMDSLNMGGAVTMLALQGLSTLILQHHLECPVLFTKLYSMFEPELFHTKHKSRLIYLTNIFLSSTTLSSAIVAAFAKRMCRLALVCGHKDAYVLLHFVANLTVRFPQLRKLRDRAEDSSNNFGKDPYVPTEEEPSLSHALQSCFWEAAVLRNHVLPPISKAASRVLGLDSNLLEIPIGTILDDDEIFDNEFKESKREVFLNHNRNPTHDPFNDFWKLN